MKNILCYGDSNTFGSNPTGGRHPLETRWTGVLQQRLGAGYRVIEEGCGGRTTVFEDEVEQGRNGRTSLPVCLASHNPLDLVVIMLGTNDLKHRYQATTWDIAKGVIQLVRIVDTYPYQPFYPKPAILLVSPILIGEGVADSPFGCFGAAAAAQSKTLAAAFEAAANQCGCAFLNAAAFASPSQTDQLHMDAYAHNSLGVALAEKIITLL